MKNFFLGHKVAHIGRWGGFLSVFRFLNNPPG
jgi:hypothetical protein